MSEEQKQKYLSAGIEIEKEGFKDLAEQVGGILYTCNIRSWQVTNLEGVRKSGMKDSPRKNPMAGKTVEEAEVIYQQYLKDLEKFKNSSVNVETDENNPWVIEMKKEDNPWTIEMKRD